MMSSIDIFINVYLYRIVIASNNSPITPALVQR